MFNRKFMEELFKPQELYSKKALRTVYDRLAHASIMRLNQASMDKVSRQPLCQLRCRPPTCRRWWAGSDRIPNAAKSWEKQVRVNMNCSRLSGRANLRRRLHSTPLLCFTCPKRALLLSPYLWVGEHAPPQFRAQPPSFPCGKGEEMAFRNFSMITAWCDCMQMSQWSPLI